MAPHSKGLLLQGIGFNQAAPHPSCIAAGDSVCPMPRSLADSNGISLIFFPAVTKMLQFTAFPFLAERFRNPRLKDCMRLTGAYRSLPRPS